MVPAKTISAFFLISSFISSPPTKTGFLSVEVNSFDQLFLKERPIYLPMVQISTIKRKYDK